MSRVEPPPGQSCASVVLSVSRSGDFEIASAVDYEIGPGQEEVVPDLPAAVAGRDLEPTRGTLTFAPGQTNATFRVTLHADGRADGDKALTVLLSKASPGVPIATRSWTLLVRDAETPLARVDPDFLPTEGRLAASTWSWGGGVLYRESLVPLGAVAVLGPDGKLIPPATGEQRLTDVERILALPDGRLAAQASDPDSGERKFFRLTTTGAIDPDFIPIPGWFVFATDANRLWLLRLHTTTGRHWLERRLLDGSPDPTATAQMVELELLNGGRVGGGWGGGGGLAAASVSAASPGLGQPSERALQILYWPPPQPICLQSPPTGTAASSSGMLPGSTATFVAASHAWT